jgi:hypothetical protein
MDALAWRHHAPAISHSSPLAFLDLARRWTARAIAPDNIEFNCLNGNLMASTIHRLTLTSDRKSRKGRAERGPIGEEEWDE